MARRTIDHRQTFAREDGWLVRTVVKPDGSSYQHRCSLDSFRDVARHIDEHATEGGHHEPVVGQPAGCPLHAGGHRAGVPQRSGLRHRSAPTLLPGLQLPDRGRPARVSRS